MVMVAPGRLRCEAIEHLPRKAAEMKCNSPERGIVCLRQKRWRIWVNQPFVTQKIPSLDPGAVHVKNLVLHSCLIDPHGHLTFFTHLLQST